MNFRSTKIISFAFSLLTCGFVQAQTDSLYLHEELQESIIQLIEDFAEEDESTTASEDLLEQLSEIEQNEDNHWSLNNLSQETAIKLLGMSEFQYYQLQLYREKYGDLVSIKELLAIPGFSFSDYQRLSQTAAVKPPIKSEHPFRNFFKRAHQTLLLRYGQVLEKQAGYEEDVEKGYIGSPQNVALRYQFKSTDHFFFGISAEKDAGEQWFKGSQKQGFDHYSISIALKNIGILKNAVIGDYRLNLGQGLAIGSALMSGKGGSAQLRQFSSGIKAVTPLSEGRFFRGAAVELGNTKFRGTLFYSHQFYDGKVTDDYFAGSLSPTGYHRTESECRKKNAMMGHVLGGDFRLSRRLFKVGIRGLWTHFPYHIQTGDALYQQFDFSGKNSFNIAVDYQCILKRAIFFGETALCDGIAWATIDGIQANFDPRITISTLFRHYAPKYHALFGSGFGGTTHNETGIYAIAEIILGKRIVLTLYNDYAAAPWLKYRTEGPSKSAEFGARFVYELSRKAKLQGRYRWKYKELNSLHESGYWHILYSQQSHSLKLGINYQPYPFLTLKTEIDGIINGTKNGEKRGGILLYQDVNLNFAQKKFSIKTRLAYFDTPSYDERLYAYEDDILFAFTVNSYYGRGCRAYIVVKYHWKMIDFWIRLAQSYHLDAQHVGSGLNLIEKRHRTEIRCQLYFNIR